MKQDLLGTFEELQRALANEYRVVPMDIPGQPIFLAVALPLAPGVTGLKPRLPSGRGMSSAQAMVAAAAEALELRASLARNNATLIAGLAVQAGRASVVAHDLRTGEAVPVPAQDVYLDFAGVTGEAPYADARSTGCAVASSRDQATRLGLFECIERDAIAFWWHGGRVASGLSRDLIDAKGPRLSWWIERRARRFQLLGLSNDIGLPVVLAVSSDPEGGCVAFGAAARFDIADAALMAVTEMIQTEHSLNRAMAAGNAEALEWAGYGSTLTLPQFDPPNDGTPMEWRALDDGSLLQRLDDLDLRALVVDMTLAGDPLPTVRVMVPGLCDMAGRIDQPRFRRHLGVTDPTAQIPRHNPEPF